MSAATIEVTGRNGYTYDATYLSGKSYIVGKYIVLVEDGVVKQTLCKATKANISIYTKPKAK